MKKTLFLLISAIFISNSLFADLLDSIVTGKFNPQYISQMKSMNDGEHYTVLKERKYILKYSYKTGEIVDTLFNAEKTKINKLKNIVAYQFSPDEKRILVYNSPKYRYRRSFTANYYLYSIQRNEMTPLSENGEQESPLFSPNGKYIAFGRKNNLFLYKIDFGTESNITKDGIAGKIINGIADWVYEEEFGQTRYFEFSPDSKQLAFVRFNESEVPTYTMQRYLNSEVKQDEIPLYPTAQIFKYPKPGQANSKVSVCVYDDFYKSVKTIKIDNTENDFYIPRIQWTTQKNKLAIFTLNRNQNKVTMHIANSKSLISKTYLVEKDKYYFDYENLDAVKFTNDGKFFTFVSERDGFRHIYLYNINGTLNRQLTKGDYDITHVYGFNDKTKTLYYQAAKQSPTQRNIFAITTQGKEKQLTHQKGVHYANFSKSYNYFIDIFSSARIPTVISLKNSKRKLVRVLEDNQQLKQKIEKLGLPQKDFFQFTTSEGVTLNGWMLKPTDFNPNKKYPALQIQYSGPNSQQVLDRWRFGWEYYLASKGFCVVSVDGRGTGGRGAEFRKSTYMQLGVLESKDQIETAQYLAQQPFINKNKISIWGWSFGGYMTLLSMSSGEKVFNSGIAVAPVTDWRLYNSCYTERFMRRPQENPKGYDAGSAIKHANKLNGKLLIIHGTADDNVHVQNTYLYLDALRNADKHAELMLYTDKNHSILGQKTRLHLYRKMFNFLENNL